MPHRLSKSRFISGDQCHLRLWYDTYQPELAEPPDLVLQAAFDAAHEVSLLARDRYPKAYTIPHDHQHVPEALQATQQLVESGSSTVLFNAAFEHDGVLVWPHILQKLLDGSWQLSQVKSATKLNHRYILDVAIQLWVLRSAGLEIGEAEVLVLNRDYVYDGLNLDVNALYESYSVLDRAEALLDRVQADSTEMLEVLEGSQAPDIRPGPHCFSPFKCLYFNHCTRNEKQSTHDLDMFGHSSVQSESLASALAELEPPVRYLDFETFNPAIPRFAGTRTYDAIPFLFSIHTEQEGNKVTHTDYIHEHDDDPRPQFVDHLIEAVGTSGSVCVYSSFEQTILNNLITALPKRTEELKAIRARLFDLLPIVRSTYHHPDLLGSYSLKSVLPVLVPELGYDDLSISDGRTASVQYEQALKIRNARERQRFFDDLRAYCERDTLALVRLRQALGALSSVSLF